MTPEGRVKALVKRWLKETYPDAYYQMPVPMGYGRNNTLDFHIYIPIVIRGRQLALPVAIETKAPRGELTKRQLQTLRELQAAGVLAYVVRDEFDLNVVETQVHARIRSLTE